MAAAGLSAALGGSNGQIENAAEIATMRQTGADMQSKYKETRLGGFAVNYVVRRPYRSTRVQPCRPSRSCGR